MKQSQEMNTEQLFHVNIFYIIDPWLRHYNVDAKRNIVTQHIGPRNMEVKSSLKKPSKRATIVAKIHAFAIP